MERVHHPESVINPDQTSTAQHDNHLHDRWFTHAESAVEYKEDYKSPG